MADMSYQVFVALDATALEGGYIYIGEQNADPEQSPIPVYWDAARTVVAAQPLRTSGGVIVRDGTPADIFASVPAYSIRVRDRSGVVVWYKPTTGGTDVSRLTFPIPSGPPGADSTVPGPADNTYTTYAALLASDPARKSARLVPQAGETEPAGNFNYINGGWVRQTASGIGYRFVGTDTDAQSALSNQPSLLDAFARTTQLQIVAGTYAADLSLGIRDAIETGTSFAVPRGTFPFNGDVLEFKTPGQVVTGNGGTLKKRGQVNGLGLLLSARGVELRDLTIDAMETNPTPYFINDAIRIQGGGGCKLVRVRSLGSSGSNLAILSGDDNEIEGFYARYAYDNNVICITSNNTFRDPDLAYTTRQNNMFFTASAGSTQNGQFIFGNRVYNPLCFNSGDSAIEFGYHCVDHLLDGGIVGNAPNPCLLMRDVQRCTMQNVRVMMKAFADQGSGTDAISVLSAFEGPTWQSDATFENIQVFGRIKRAMINPQQSGVRGSIQGRPYSAGTNPATDGSDLAGAGVLLPEAVSNIDLKVDLDGYAAGVSTLFSDAVHTLTNVSISGKATRCNEGLVLRSGEFVKCSITLDGDYRTRAERLSNAKFIPDATNPNRSLRRAGSLNPSTYYPGVGYAPYDDITNAWALLRPRDSSWFRLPANGEGSGSVILVPQVQANGIYSVFASGTRSAVFNAAGPAGVVTRAAGSTNLNGDGTATGIQLVYSGGTMNAINRDAGAPAAYLKIEGPWIQ